MPQASRSVSSRPSLRARVSPGEWQTRVDLAAAHRFVVVKGWQQEYSLYGHLSARVPGEPESFLLKPHDLMFGEVTASNLIKLNLHEPKGFKDNINAAGFAIHAAVLKARSDVNSVMHLHSVPGMAVAALQRGLMFLTQESMMFYKRIGYHKFEGIAGLDEQERIVRDLGLDNKVLILNSHGLLMCNSSVGAAAMTMGELITLAEVQLAVLATGEKVIEPSPEICEETAKMFGRYEASIAEDWTAVVRWLDRQDSSYRD